MYNRPLLLVPLVTMVMMMVRYSTLVTLDTPAQSPRGDGGLDVSVTVSMTSSAIPHWV